MALIVILLIFIVAIVLILRRNAADVPEIDEWEQTPAPQHKLEIAYKVQFMTVVKIVLGYTQIKSLLIEVYTGVQWPDSYRSFTGGLQFLSSNPLSIVMPSCLSPSLTITAYSEFVIAAVAPLVVVPIVLIYYQVKTRAMSGSSTGGDAEKLKAVCISTGSFVYYLLYPTIAVASVRVLAECDEICRTDDDSDCIQYLRADYSIQCGTSKHRGYKVAASFAFVVYSLVAPAAIAFLLYRGRHGDTKSTISALMAGFSFYSKQFKPEFFFWETVDLYRKLMITSMVVFVADGTSLQVTFGVIFAMAGFVLQLVYNPYVYIHENRLAVASQAITLLALIVGGLIRATEAEEAARMKTGQINGIVAGAYLVTSGLLLYCWVLVLFILFKYFKNSIGSGSSTGIAGHTKGANSSTTALSATELRLIQSAGTTVSVGTAATATSTRTAAAAATPAKVPLASSAKSQNFNKRFATATNATPAYASAPAAVQQLPRDFYRTTNNPLVFETRFDTPATRGSARGGTANVNNEQFNHMGGGGGFYSANVGVGGGVGSFYDSNTGIGIGGGFGNGGGYNADGYNQSGGYDDSYLDVDFEDNGNNNNNYGFSGGGTYF